MVTEGHISRWAGRAAAGFVFAATASCFPDFASDIPCGDSSQCPSGFVCGSGICVEGSDTGSAGADAPAMPEDDGTAIRVAPVAFEDVIATARYGITVRNRVIVSTKPFSAPGDLQELTQAAKGSVISQIPPIGVYELAVKASDEAALTQKLGELGKAGFRAEVHTTGGFDALEPDIANYDGANDASLWAFAAIGLPAAWASYGEVDGPVDAVAAVIDGPIALESPEIGSRLAAAEFHRDLAHASKTPGLTEFTKLVDGELPSVWQNHGTRVAALVAGVNGNGGPNGVAPRGDMLPINIAATAILAARQDAAVAAITNQHFFNMHLAAAIAYAVERQELGQLPVRVIAVAGGSKYASHAVQSALDYARDYGVLVVTSAGNAGADAASHYPAGYEHSMSVGATACGGKRSPAGCDGPLVYASEIGDGASNYGLTAATLTVAAPGERVCTVSGLSQDCESFSGTSAAAALTAGAALLLATAQPEADAASLWTLLAESGPRVDEDVPAGEFALLRVDLALQALLASQAQKK